MKYFIDTNIFLRTLVKEDERSFDACQKFLAKVKRQKIKGLTGSLVLAETVWTLSSYYRFSRRQVVKAIKSIISLKNLKIIDNYNHPLALELFNESKVKYIDSLMASIDQVQEKKWQIVSYDKDFDKLGIRRIEPGDL
jgi:predicted nucleic-acid-binding protein